MIRFVDIETGNVFNGDFPYIFWIDGEQSINLIYSKPICFISHTESVNISIPQDNEVFRLLSINDENYNKNLLNINDIEYVDISNLYANNNTININGTKHRGFYVYIFYIVASSNNIGEYVETFSIKENGIIHEYKIGADFYGENEFNYINLYNNGIDIPDTVQKALYTTNIHEDKKDNITLNRKWKELLSNYWDIVANKGSYKSLYNSLEWFEYGDVIKLLEIWKHDDCGKTIYDERNIKEILGNKYFETLNGFSKTTYLAISSALEKISSVDGVTQYDEEKNPILKNIIRDWSIQDISLKLSMLGSFFKTFFMPIHLDLIRSTIEDVVYSNTIKYNNSNVYGREDYVYNVKDFLCNVKNNDTFKLEPLSCRVGSDTMFGNMYNSTWTDYDKVEIVGVQKHEPSIYTDNQLKTYASQYYNHIGAIINFEITIPLKNNDFIKRSVLRYVGDKSNNPCIIEDRKIRDKKIEFSLLCTKAQDYKIVLEFHSVDGEVYVKSINFSVIDTSQSFIKIYKIQNIGDPVLNKHKINEYSFGRLLGNKNTGLFKQYIPCKITDPTVRVNYEGVCLNHFLIIKNNVPVDKNNYIKDNYFTQVRKINDDLTYTICLSKRFGFKPNYAKLMQYDIYREDYVFYPDFHKLIELGSKNKQYNISDYTITDEDAICIIPELSYGKYIKEAQWEFINTSDPKKSSIIPPVDIKEPFIAPDTESFLKPGYYNIVFRYRLAGEDQINTIELNSAFL